MQHLIELLRTYDTSIVLLQPYNAKFIVLRGSFESQAKGYWNDYREVPLSEITKWTKATTTIGIYGLGREYHINKSSTDPEVTWFSWE